MRKKDLLRGVGLNMPLNESYSWNKIEKMEGWFGCGHRDSQTIFIRPSIRWHYSFNSHVMFELNKSIDFSEIDRHDKKHVFKFICGLFLINNWNHRLLIISYVHDRFKRRLDFFDTLGKQYVI
jgi:hypothetical protein